MLKTFEDFAADERANDMYITGAAGTGKTTSLRQITDTLNEEEYVVCAFTHKAKGILASKGIKNTMTLHSLLKKRPSVNTNATNIKQVQLNIVMGKTNVTPTFVFIDEFSMVGEKDLMDLRSLQDGMDQPFKVVWLGDTNQLPPVGDQFTIKPGGKYSVKLTKQYRNDNPLQKPLNALISMINGAPLKPLEAVDRFFIRNKDIVKSYIESCTEDKVLLAYTNKRVQELNQLIADEIVDFNSEVFSPTRHEFLTMLTDMDAGSVDCIRKSWGDEEVVRGSKFKTLEYLVNAFN